MRQQPVIIAHYTINTGYEVEVKKLIDSLIRLNLEYDITPMESLGTWRANSNYSVELIERMLKKHPNRSILKTDADAIFHKVPKLFEQDDFDCDFAARWQDFKYKKQELLGGTLYFANNKIIMRLIQKWKEAVNRAPKARNPELLDDIIKRMDSELKVTNLPPEYCKIFDIMRRYKNPVIEHFQASRRFKRTINADGRNRP